MEITNDGYDLRLVEVARKDDKHILYQVWEDRDAEVEAERDHVADPEEVYEVNVVGLLENPSEYGEKLEHSGSIAEVAPETYEWRPNGSGDRVQSFGYNESDPRDGERPDTAAELSQFDDEELEEVLGSAFTGTTLGAYKNR